MDRRTLLKSAFAGLAWQLGADAQKQREGFLVPAGEDRSHAEVTIAKCKLSGQDTGGALGVFGGHKSGPGAVPLHVHLQQDEWWYVLEGEYVFQIGEKRLQAKAGDSVFGPRGVPHSPRQISPQGITLTVFQPAGSMEEFFHELAQAARKAGGMPPVPVTAALFKAHGMEIKGPPVEP
jgi:mannose-6-phosphate isomerase-like protein (cupin superfamily)